MESPSFPLYLNLFFMSIGEISGLSFQHETILSDSKWPSVCKERGECKLKQDDVSAQLELNRQNKAYFENTKLLLQSAGVWKYVTKYFSDLLSYIIINMDFIRIIMHTLKSEN